jgi:hypothetical protein
MGLVDWVMGLSPGVKVVLFGDYNLNTGKTHVVKYGYLKRVCY